MNFDTIKPDEIRVMYQQAANKREILTILAQLTCSHENDICDILGIPRSKERKDGRIDDETALEMFKNGNSEKEIAKAFGVSVNAVYAWKLEKGLICHSPEREKRFEGVRALYDQGLTDPKIAQQTGMSVQTILFWRKEHGLKANWKPKIRDWAEEDKRFRTYYEQGLTDSEIADLCNCNYWNVRDWRQHMGLVHNGPKSKDGKPKKGGRKPLDWGEVDKLCRPLYESGLNDPKIQAATGIDQRTVCAWRKREKLPSQRSCKQ